MLSNKEIGQAMQIKLDATLPEYPAFVEGIRRAPDPVSYTHLDVYKRQG